MTGNPLQDEYWKEAEQTEGVERPAPTPEFEAQEDVEDAQTEAADAKVAEDEANDLNYLLAKPRGRRWVYHHIWDTCHYGRLSSPMNDEGTAFNEGARSVGIVLHDAVQRQRPDMYLKMLEENHFDG